MTRRHPPRALVSALALALASSIASRVAADAADSLPADPGSDAAAPSLAVDEDVPVPFARLAIGLDPLAFAFGVYGIQIEVAVARVHGVWFAPAWIRAEGIRGFGLEAGYRLWPLARGLSGPFAGPFVGLALERRAPVAADVGAELGYQHVWRGLAVGGALGVARRWRWGRGQDRREVAVRVRLQLGWAWM